MHATRTPNRTALLAAEAAHLADRAADLRRRIAAEVDRTAGHDASAAEAHLRNLADLLEVVGQ